MIACILSVSLLAASCSREEPPEATYKGIPVSEHVQRLRAENLVNLEEFVAGIDPTSPGGADMMVELIMIGGQAAPRAVELRLRRVGAAAVDPFVKLLDSPDTSVREGSLRALGYLRDASAPAQTQVHAIWVAALRGKEPSLLGPATTTLCESGPAAATLVLEQLRDKKTRNEASALLQQWGLLACPPLEKAARQDTDKEFCEEVLNVLSVIKAGSGNVERHDWWYRMYAGIGDQTPLAGGTYIDAETLKRFRLQKATAAVAREKLTRILRESNSPMDKRAAVHGLGGLGPYASPALADIIPLLREPDPLSVWFALDTLYVLGEPAATAMPDVIPLLDESNDRGTRWRAALVLRRVGAAARSAAPELIKLLHDRDDRMSDVESVELHRGIAALALAECAPDLATPELIPMLKEEYWRMRMTGADGLAICGHSAMFDLEALLADKDPANRRGAALALYQIGPVDSAAWKILSAIPPDEDEFVEWARQEAISYSE